jgi:hypothetical protein
MSTTEIGDRYTDQDGRNAGRVVQVEALESRRKGLYAWVVCEVHPNNPEAVGRHSWIRVDRLHTHFALISR